MRGGPHLIGKDGEGWASFGKDGEGWASFGKDGEGWDSFGKDGKGWASFGMSAWWGTWASFGDQEQPFLWIATSLFYIEEPLYPHQKTLLNGINELGVGLNHLGRVGWYVIEA